MATVAAARKRVARQTRANYTASRFARSPLHASFSLPLSLFHPTSCALRSSLSACCPRHRAVAAVGPRLFIESRHCCVHAFPRVRIVPRDFIAMDSSRENCIILYDLKFYKNFNFTRKFKKILSMWSFKLYNSNLLTIIKSFSKILCSIIRVYY